MKWREWLDQWSMTGLKVKAGFVEAEFKPNDHDKNAAWALYIELLTRVATQPLGDGEGDESAALSSVYEIIEKTRDILKEPETRHAREFSKIAILVLNQKIRPFTTEWHKASLNGSFSDPVHCTNFRKQLGELRIVLVTYAKALAAMAGAEDLTWLAEP